MLRLRPLWLRRLHRHRRPSPHLRRSPRPSLLTVWPSPKSQQSCWLPTRQVRGFLHPNTDYTRHQNRGDFAGRLGYYPECVRPVGGHLRKPQVVDSGSAGAESVGVTSMVVRSNCSKTICLSCSVERTRRSPRVRTSARTSASMVCGSTFISNLLNWAGSWWPFDGGTYGPTQLVIDLHHVTAQALGWHVLDMERLGAGATNGAFSRPTSSRMTPPKRSIAVQTVLIYGSMLCE